MTFLRKIETPHRTFIATQMAEFTSAPSKIKAMLADPEKAKEFDFEPVEVTEAYLGKLMLRDEDIKNQALQFQVRYLIDYSKIRLAHKKERVLELIRIYESIDDLTNKKGEPLSNLIKLDKKRMILAQIASETDETMGKLAEAILEKTTNLTINMTLQDKLLGYFEAPGDTKTVDIAQAKSH